MFLAKEKYIKWVHMTISWEKKAFILSWQSGNYTKKMVNMYVIMITYIKSLFDNTYVLVEYILSHLDICQVTHVCFRNLALWIFMMFLYLCVSRFGEYRHQLNEIQWHEVQQGKCWVLQLRWGSAGHRHSSVAQPAMSWGGEVQGEALGSAPGTHGRTHGNCTELCQGRLGLDIRKHFFIVRAVRHWDRLPGEVAGAPCPSVFKKHLVNASITCFNFCLALKCSGS